jgi:hypothetical protein
MRTVILPYSIAEFCPSDNPPVAHLADNSLMACRNSGDRHWATCVGATVQRPPPSACHLLLATFMLPTPPIFYCLTTRHFCIIMADNTFPSQDQQNLVWNRSFTVVTVYCFQSLRSVNSAFTPMCGPTPRYRLADLSSSQRRRTSDSFIVNRTL